MLLPALFALTLRAAPTSAPPPLPEPGEVVEQGEGPLYYRELPPKLGLMDLYGVGLRLSPRTGDSLSAALDLHTEVGGLYQFRRGGHWSLLGEVGFTYASVPEFMGSAGLGPVLGELGPSLGSHYEPEVAGQVPDPGAMSIALVPQVLFGSWRGALARGFGASAILALGPVGIELAYQRISTDVRTVGEVQLALVFALGLPGMEL